MVSEMKRSYYLPRKLIGAFDQECRRQGFVRQRALAAALYRFLKASPTDRQRMLTNLAGFLGQRG